MKLNSKKVCGLLGLAIIALGAVLAHRGLPGADWIALIIGAVLLTYAMYTGESVLLFDLIRRKR